MKNVPLLEVADCIKEVQNIATNEITLITPEQIGEFGQKIVSSMNSERQLENYQSVNKGDVLLSSSVDDSKVVFIHDDLAESYFSTRFIILRPNPKLIDSSYLFWYLNSQFFHFEKKRLSTNGNVKCMGESFLESVNVPIPKTITEQKEIAAGLNRVAGICLEIYKGASLADNLIRSEFITKFGSPLTNGKQLSKSPVSKMAKVFKWDSTYSLIEKQNVDSSKNVANTMQKFDNSLLVTNISETKNEIGKVKFWKDKPVGLHRDFHLIPDRRTNPYFLFCQLQIGQKLIEDRTEFVERFKIDQNRFEEIELLNPCKSSQDEFGNLFSKVQVIKSNFLTKLDKCKKLLLTLSQQGFK